MAYGTLPTKANEPEVEQMGDDVETDFPEDVEDAESTDEEEEQVLENDEKVE